MADRPRLLPPLRFVPWSLCVGLLGIAVLVLDFVPADEPSARPKGPTLTAGSTPLKPLVTGLNQPTAATVGFAGSVFVTGRTGKGEGGEGAVFVIESGKPVPFITGLKAPTGIVAGKDALFVADDDRIVRIDPKAKMTVLAPASAFPAPSSLLGLDIDEVGTLYATARTRSGIGVVYRINPRGRVTEVASSTRQLPLMANPLKSPHGLRLDSMSFAYVQDASSGDLARVRLADGLSSLVGAGLAVGQGLAVDYHGRLYLADQKKGQVLVIGRPGDKAMPVAAGFEDLRGLCLAPKGKSILAVDRKAGTLTAIPTGVPGRPIDEKSLGVEAKAAFPDIKWEGWTGSTPAGKIVAHRPLVLTHAGDGTNRVFVATQHGVLHVFPNDQKAKKAPIFLDIQDRVRYSDASNEEGLLGLCFHPEYKKNGEFFVFYTSKQQGGPHKQQINIVSRFRVSKDNPDKADAKSEEVLIRFEKPFWNHDGGTLCFGPDGYLYVTHGDGGSGNDPYQNGQNLNTLLGKILRIDVNRKESAKQPYGIPKDNPFVGVVDTRPEIWAYGLRNVWRMAFDRETGRLWAADVGQNLWEEIDLIVRGGNYGWNLREGLHTFGPGGSGPRADLIDPIWEYHHDVGKSITGGHVYRGKRVPALLGKYLYADYVSGAIAALQYDEKQNRVVGNHPIRVSGVPIYSFGEDEKGEVYALTSTTSGQGIFWFAATKEGKP